MSWIMLSVHWIIILAVYISFRSAARPGTSPSYRRILLGIQLPGQYLQEPAVRGILADYKKIMLLYLIVSLVSGLLYPFLKYILQIRWWILPGLIWLIADFIIAGEIYKHFVGKMFWLKTEQGWLTGTKRFPIRGRDGREYMTDEDYYWRKGGYANPDDPAILVPKRTGLGMELNTGRKPALILMAVTFALFFLILGKSVFYPLIWLENRDFTLAVRRNEIEVQSPSYAAAFSPDEVTKIRLIDGYPDGALRVGGMSTDSYLIGNFTCDEYGKGKWYLHTDQPAVIYIGLEEGYILINQKTEEETLALYRQLRKGEQILYFLPSIRI